MALIKVNDVAVKGVCCCVPPQIMDNMTQTFYKQNPSAAARKEFIRTTGIRELRFADADVCGSDLAHQAGEKLLNDMNCDRSSIDSLIFLTQTPDYLNIPPTSCILQHRLGLSTECSAFDMIHNCGGFVIGLHTAFAHAALGMRVLLLIGETLSRTMSPYEDGGGLLFGDGGAALLIEPTPGAEAWFSLNSDGGGFDAIMIEGGGYRNMASEETLRYRTDIDGVVRNMHQGRLDKMRVVDFTMERIAPDVTKLLEFSGFGRSDISKVFLHQANASILKIILMQLGFPPEIAPITLDRFGNTSTLSIPLGIAADLGDDCTGDRGRLLLSGFGGGLSWGGAVVSLSECYIGKVVDYVRP